MACIADACYRKDVSTGSVLAYVHSRKKLRVDAEDNVRTHWFAGTNTSRQTILPVLQQAVASELDSVACKPPKTCRKIGRVFLNFRRLHRAIVPVEFGQNVLRKLWRKFNYPAIHRRP